MILFFLLQLIDYGVFLPEGVLDAFRLIFRSPSLSFLLLMPPFFLHILNLSLSFDMLLLEFIPLNFLPLHLVQGRLLFHLQTGQDVYVAP